MRKPHLTTVRGEHITDPVPTPAWNERSGPQAQSGATADVSNYTLTEVRRLFGPLAADDRTGRITAVLKAHSRLEAGQTSRSRLAAELGYASELEFFEESFPLSTTDPRPWFATRDRRTDAWVLWCDRTRNG